MRAKKSLLLLLFCAFCFSALGLSRLEAADASKFPEKNIIMTYYTKPGSGGDTFMRNLAVALSKELNGHNLVVENIVDPSGATSWGKVQRSKADGYRLAFLSSTIVTADIIGGSPVKYGDFDYICGMGMDPQYIFCKTDAPFNSLPELIDYCRKNPGKINWGTAAPTSASTICSVLVINKAKIDVNRVIYQTGGDTFVAMLGGFVDIGVGEYIDMRSQVEAGKVKLLCVLAKERTSLKDIPTAREGGFDIVFDRPRGFAAPKGTDPAIIARIAEIFKKAYDSPAFMTYLQQEAIDPVFQSGEEFLMSYRKIADIIEENKGDIVGTQKK